MLAEFEPKRPPLDTAGIDVTVLFRALLQLFFFKGQNLRKPRLIFKTHFSSMKVIYCNTKIITCNKLYISRRDSRHVY